MTKIQLIGNSFVLFLISFLLISCSSVPRTADNQQEINKNINHSNTADQSKEIKSESRFPIIEIWQERDGSVPIRGKSLYFRLYDDADVEFDYQLRKENKLRSPRYTYSFERTPSAKISDEEFRSLKSLLEDLIKSKDVKKEYKPFGLIFDSTIKLTILLREDETTEKEVIINNHPLDVIDSKFEKKFPNLLINLFKEVQIIRDRSIKREGNENATVQ